MTENGKKQPAAVYVAWGTFKNAIDGLAQAIPNRIDKTVYPGLNPAVVNQLLTGFKFLGLTDDNGRPSSALQSIATKDESVRKQQLASLIRQRYQDLFELDLTKTTPAELAEKMEKSYNVTGDTRDKAIRFFLSALAYVGITVSSLLAKSSSNGAPTKKRRSSRPKAPIPPAPEVQQQSPSDSGSSRVIRLVSGGTLTVVASLNFLALTPPDRKFFSDLIDRLDEYEKDKEGASSTS